MFFSVIVSLVADLDVYQAVFLFCIFKGWCFAHSLIAIVISYLLLHIVGPSIVMVCLTFVFNMVSGPCGVVIFFAMVMYFAFRCALGK